MKRKRLSLQKKECRRQPPDIVSTAPFLLFHGQLPVLLRRSAGWAFVRTDTHYVSTHIGVSKDVLGNFDTPSVFLARERICVDTHAGMSIRASARVYACNR